MVFIQINKVIKYLIISEDILMKKSIIKILALLFIFSISCAHKILKKPDINIVKKIAIISVYSNSVVYKIGGEGGSFAAITSLISKKEENSDKENSFGGKRLVNYALKIYTDKLATIDGWKIVSHKKIINSKAYKNFKKIKKEQQGAFSKLTTTVNKIAYAFPTGMFVYRIKEQNYNGDELKALCKELQVDAVAIIELDMAYKIATSIKAVNFNGKMVIGTLDIKKGAGMRSTSDNQTPMISGEIIFNNKVEKMYQQAIDADADKLVAKMKKEFSEK
jgi:hypothetical protein